MTRASGCGRRGILLVFSIAAMGPPPAAFSALEASVSRTDGKPLAQYHMSSWSLPAAWRKENGSNVARSKMVLL